MFRSCTHPRVFTKTTATLLFVLLIGFSAPAFSQQAGDTIVGCLARTDRPGLYSLRQRTGGPPLQVTGDLDRFVGNNEIRLSGSTQREGNTDVFRATSAEQLGTTCPLTSGVPDTMEELRESVGAANVGVRGGIGFDPELIYLGAHAQLALVDSIWFRPSYEFGFGEVTQIQSLNLEFAYYLPFTARSGDGARNTWNTYIGAGPALHLVRQDFDIEAFDEDLDPENEDLGFTDWDFDTGLNFLMGVSRRNGMFVELRGGAYGSPSIKIVVGYTFR